MPSLIDSIPAIIGFNAHPGTSFIPPIPTLHIEFSVKMLLQSLNTDPAVNIGMSLYDGDVTVELSYLDYVVATKTLKVQPTTALTPGTTYKLIIHSKSDGFLSAAGRPLHKSTFYEFTVSEISFPKLQLVSPGNGVVVPDQILITTFVPAITGSAVVIAQLSQNRNFAVVDWVGAIPASASVNHELAVTPAPLTDTTYYLRTRLLDATSGFGGEWSDIWNFYYGSRESVYPESRRQIEDEETYFSRVTSIGFTDGNFNLTTWPSISVTFSADIPTGSTNYFSIIRQPVDAASPTSVAGDWTIVGSVATFTPTEEIRNNSRYTLTLSAGLVDSLGSELPAASYYFVSRYTPFYAQPLEVRAVLGGMIGDVSDDLIAYFIHKVSLDVNWRSRLQPTQMLDPLYIFGGASVSDLQITRNPALYAINQWTILGAAMMLLQTKLFEFVPGADGSLQIADYRESLGSSNVLRFINDKIKELRLKQEEYEMQFSRKALRPRTGVRSATTSFGTQTSFDKGYKPGRHSF